MVDQWIKRVGAEKATLQVLQDALEKMGRLDAVEEIKKAIIDLRGRSPEDLDRVANKHNSKLRRAESSMSLKRSDSCMSLCPSANFAFVEESISCGERVDLSESNISIEKPSKKSKLSLFGSRLSLNKKSQQNSIEKKQPIRNMKNDSKATEKTANEAPLVYVVCTTEDVDHHKAVIGMVEKLREDYAIDVKSELFESSDYEEDKACYIYSNLLTAEWVLFVCTETTGRSSFCSYIHV